MTSKTRGIIGSFVVHIAILVLLILFGFSTPLPLPGEQGILINFGDDIQGDGLEEPRKAPIEETKPIQQKPEEPEPKPITQDFEEAPSIPVPKTEVKPKPEKKKPDEKPKEQPKPEEKPREVDQRILFPGKKTTGGTTGEGETGTQGNQGDPTGSPDSQSRVGGTTSGGEGISFSLQGRASLSLPQPEYPSQRSGRVVVEVRVDRNGNVTSARGGVKGSTTTDEALIKAAEAAARKAKFDVSPNAPDAQQGTITYVFRLQQ